MLRPLSPAVLRHRRRRSPLVVYFEDNDIVRAFCNSTFELAGASARL